MLLDAEERARLERLSLRSRGRVRGMWSGRHASLRRGESLDFADYREYVPGDDFRRIDHNLRARLGVVLVRLFEAEDEMPLRVLCDCSGSMAFGLKFATARRLAAALAYLALAGGERVKPIAVPGRDGLGVSAGAFSRHLAAWPRVEAWLEALSPGGGTDLGGAIRLIGAEVATRGPVAMISDLLTDGWQQVLDQVGVAGRGGVVLHVLAPEELDPDLVGDLRLVDSETGERVEVSTSAQALDAYRREVAAFVAEAEGRAHRNGLSYLLVRAEPGALDRAIGDLAAREVVR